MTWLMAGLAAIVSVAVIEFTVTRVTERRAARRISAALRAHTRVRIRSWPAAVHLWLDGVHAAIHAVDVPIPERDAALTRLDVDLVGVRLRRTTAEGRSGLRLRAAAGAFTAAVDEVALHALSPVPTLRSVEIGDDGVRYILPGGVAVDGVMTVDDGDLIFTPASGPLGVLRIVRLAAPIGRLPLGAELERLEFGDAELLAHGRLTDPTLELP